MHEVCQKYAGNMQIYAKNMQVQPRNMQEICKYIDCISQICKKYAVQKCRNMQFYIAYFAFICTSHFADVV